jgi:hypothetical protein
MVRLLNNFFLVTLLLMQAFVALSQSDRTSDKDFQNKEQFKKFNKRSSSVASWQIQNLKYGAVVVRLQNNKRKIDAYTKVGDLKNAIRVQAETQYHNRLIVRSFLNKFDFCKVYFIYAQNSDTLLNGARTSIFLDSTLKVNHSITMNESFYLIIEEDLVYASSIGFVKEDTAKYQVEKGSSHGYPKLVFKNKYGHQLKPPFPVHERGNMYLFVKRIQVRENIKTADGKDETITFLPERKNTYKVISEGVMGINASLHMYYDRSKGDQITDQSLTPFLY